MAFQVVALFALVAAVNAAVIPHQLIHEPEVPAHYNFHYQVNDPVTGDQKHQEETREGDAVHGSYSLVESDGTRRIVEYTADDVNGFQAVVHKEHADGVAHVAPIAKVVKPVVSVAPSPVHVVPHVVPAPVVTKVATYPTVRGYPGAYSPYYSGLHPYSGYQPYTGYQPYSGYQPSIGYNAYSGYQPFSGYRPYSGVYSPYQH